MEEFLYEIYPFAIIISSWMLLAFIFSFMGWARLAKKFKTSETFNGVKLGAVTAFINNAWYREALIIRYNNTGIYLKTIFIFRLFHPPLFIPWDVITEVRDKFTLVLGRPHELKELVIGNPCIATLQLKKTTFSEIEHEIIRHSIKQ